MAGKKIRKRRHPENCPGCAVCTLPFSPLLLPEVVRRLGAASRTLSRLDDDIGRNLAAIEEAIRRRRLTGYPLDVPFPPWGKLGWSGRRGRWRLVVIDEDVCEDLRQMPRECRTDACFVLRKLVARLGLTP